MSDVVVLPRRKPRVLADLVPRVLGRDVLLTVGGAVIVGLLAQVSIHLSFTPVPVTGQTLGVLLCGTTLGWRRGMAALALYAVAGVAGVPWFAGHTGGYVGASFGYVVGFVFCATLSGRLAERGADRTVWKSIPAMIAGEAAMYVVGVGWLAVSLHVGPAEAIALGFTPFLVGDAVKALLVALLLPGAWKLVGTRR